MSAPPARLPLDVWDAARVWCFYSTVLVKGGHKVGCTLRIESEYDEDGELFCDERLVANINGTEIDATYDVPRLWPWRAVTQQECDYLLSLGDWARKNDANHALAMPEVPMDKANAPIW